MASPTEEIQSFGVPLPSTSAEDYGNDPRLEQQWAVKAFQHAETYFELLKVLDPKLLKLTPHDNQIYKRFREMFPTLRIDVLEEETLKSPQAKEEWRKFCEEFRELIDDFNFGTLLRSDASGEYSNENTILVVRVQFYAIEIARNREGNNSMIRSKFCSK